VLVAADELVQDLPGRRVLEVLRQQVRADAGTREVGNWSIAAVRRGGLHAVGAGLSDLDGQVTVGWRRCMRAAARASACSRS
jgi:hypothetical protein